MSAAVEGSLEEIPSIGFSLLDYSVDADFSECEKYILKIAQSVILNGLPDGVCLNVNIPKIKPNKAIKGIRVCRQSKAHWDEEFVERKDPSGRKYYWLTGKFVNNDKGKDTDENALKQHYISVVPVQYDMTDHNSISKINEILS